MEDRTLTLHILTPLGHRTRASLLDERLATAGDLVVDLTRFPPVVYAIGEEQTLRDITDSLVTAPDYWTVAREWLLEFTEQTGLQDTLAVRGYGFWWTLGGQRFVAGLSELGNMFAWVDLLHAVSEGADPICIVVYGQHDPILHLSHQIWKGVETQVQPGPPTSRGGESASRRIGRGIGLLSVRVLLSVLYLIYTLIWRPDLCFFSGTNLLRRVASGPRQRLFDIYLGEVVQACRSRGWRVTVVEKYGWNASWEGLKARGWFFPDDIIFLLSTPILSRLGFYRRVVNKWHTEWADVCTRLSPYLRYRGYDLDPFILPLLAREFTRHAPDLEVMITIWRHILRIWRPQLLYVNNSYGRSALTAVIAAKTLNIPTVEQQHGVIGRNHIAYLVPRRIKTRSDFPLCDTMVVWGEHTKRMLVDAGVYKAEQVSVCGFPRADMLLKSLPPRSQTLAQLGIPPDSEVVLYTSNEFARSSLPQILDSIMSLPSSSNLYWIVKLHPRETTFGEWNLAIKERQLQTVKVVKGGFDFYALLAACDIHVSFASTTLIEAAILGKPNLGLEVAHASDPAGYADAKAFLPVAPGRMGPTAYSILHDTGRRERLLREQKAFADAWCLHDGHAVDRIISHVEGIVSRGRR